MADERRAYVEDPRFANRREDERGGTAPVTVVYNDAPRRGCLWSCFSGCLMFLGAVFLLLIVVAFFMARNWQNWIPDLGSRAAKATLDVTDLPEAEKAEIGVEIDRLAQAMRDGKISQERAAMIMQQIAASPLATSIIVSVVDGKYIAASGLSNEEKEAGRQACARFARGVLDGVIPEPSRDATLRKMMNEPAPGRWELKPTVTDDELRAFLASAKADADAAQIPIQADDVDPSAELKKIVDEALGAAAVAPPAGPR